MYSQCVNNNVAVSTGGVLSVQWLFTVPRASNSLMNAGVPYSRAALNELLAEEDVSRACSADTARVMSAAVFKKTVSELLCESRDLNSLSTTNIFALSCTAALVSTQPKKGQHRCHVGATSSRYSCTWSLYMNKGERSREEEDYACSRLLLDAVSYASGVPPLSERYMLEPCESGSDGILTEQVYTAHSPFTAETALANLLNSKSGMAVFVSKGAEMCGAAGSPAAEDCGESDMLVYEDIRLPKHTIVYPGSFNPLHEGHVQLAVSAVSAVQEAHPSLSSVPVVFELSILNADKPPLGTEDVLRRVRQFLNSSLLQSAGLLNVAVCVTSRPLFAAKAALFPGCTFLIGSDTLSRLIDPKYYAHSRENMVAALATIIGGDDDKGCRFVVGGRVDKSGVFVSCEEVLGPAALPPQLSRAFLSISEAQFRCDLSSTEIRDRQS
jgi:nicotinic acid mononucleotide adenylyltransferase